jgi:hypothetical protein
MEPTIFAQIRKESQDFYYGFISVVPGYTFNQYNIIKRVHLYLNSKYEDDSEYHGKPKLFYNVVIPACEVAMRMLNIDTKNIRLWAMNPKSQFSTYLLEKELKLWLKMSKLGKILNQIAEEAPRYGSIVLEKIPGGAKVVDLRKLIMDPTVDTIQQSRFITTINYMTTSEILATGWENAQEAVTKFGSANGMQSYEDKSGMVTQQQSSPYIKVYKRYGEVPAHWLDKKLVAGTPAGDKLFRSVFIVCGADSVKKNADGQNIGEEGLVLFRSKWTKPYPFKDFHYMKTKGRWLGIGIVEMLFDVQVRMNEIKNQKRVSMEISSMHLFQTKDKSIVRNVMTDLESGDLLLTQNGIEPIANEERNLPAFKDEEISYQHQVDNLSFAYEAIRGETTDSSTPLGTTQIAVAQGTSVYAFKKENLSLFLQDFFNDLVMPELMKDLTPEHIMRFTGSLEELAKLDEAAAELHANDYVKQQILDDKIVTQEDMDAAKQSALEQYRKLGDSRFLKIKDAFYDDAEFEFDFLVTNEQDDPTKIVSNTQAVFTALAANPAILDDPRIKLLFYKFAQQLGVSPADIELADSQHKMAAQAQAKLPAPLPTDAPAKPVAPVLQ